MLEKGEGPGLWVWEEPIFHNPFIQLDSICSGTQQLLREGWNCDTGPPETDGRTGWKTATVRGVRG